MQSKIEKKLRRIVSNGKSGVQLWTSIEARLRKEAHQNSKIHLHFDTRVKSLHQNEEKAWLITSEGESFEADIIIGADGHRSIVRDEIDPDHPNANYAGYVVWMASIKEDKLDPDKRPQPRGRGVEMFNSAGGFMFGSIIEDHDGIRRIGCTWYDNTQTELLTRLGAIEGKVVHHSLDGDDLSDNDIINLANQASKKWPEPWKSATLEAIHSRDFIGIPIKEYIPNKLSKNRFAIVGDAAHVPAPITASGFNESLKDAATLYEVTKHGLQDQQSKKSSIRI